MIYMVGVWIANASDSGTHETVANISANNDQVFLALIALVGTSIAALSFAIKNNYLGKQINQAVNNVGPGEHHLIDLIKQIRVKQEDFDRKWGNLPNDMDDAVSLVEMLHGMEKRIEKISSDLAEHIALVNADPYKEMT